MSQRQRTPPREGNLRGQPARATCEGNLRDGTRRGVSSPAPWGGLRLPAPGGARQNHRWQNGAHTHQPGGKEKSRRLAFAPVARCSYRRARRSATRRPVGRRGPCLSASPRRRLRVHWLSVPMTGLRLTLTKPKYATTAGRILPLAATYLLTYSYSYGTQYEYCRAPTLRLGPT